MRKILMMNLMVSVVVGVLCANVSHSQPLLMKKNPSEGKPVVEFSLPTLRTKKATLSQLRDGQKAIIFFWATWCPHCRSQLKELSRMKSEIEAEGIKVILVDVGESAQQVNKHVEKNNIPFDVLLDEDSEVSEEYNIIGVPTFFFVNEAGVVTTVEHALPENLDKVFTQ